MSQHNSNNPSLIHRPTLPLSLAQSALQASITQAKHLNVPVNISIFSDSLQLLAFARMDDAKLTSIDIAHNKAFTAAGHRLDTGEYGNRVHIGGSLAGIQHSNGGRFCTIKGGLPILMDGICLGGVGVSGGTPDQDKEVARAGVEAILAALSGQPKERAKL